MITIAKDLGTTFVKEVQEKDIMTKEYWEGVVLAKALFVDHGIDPRENGLVREEVAESWIRSKNNGIHPDTSYLEYRLEENEFQKVIELNKLLVDVSRPLINSFLELAASSGHSLELFDKNGVFLSGIHIRYSSAHVISMIWNEHTTGTTAHGLAIYHKKPFQVIGPENYLNILNDSIGTAAPIFNENGEVMGALALIQQFTESPWKQDTHKISSYSLGWVSSLAAAIENQIKLHTTNQSLCVLNKNLNKNKQILKATLEFIDEGVITIDSDGTILNTNQESNRILALNQDSSEGRNISEFLSNRSTLMNIVSSKKNVDFLEEYIKVNGEEKPYLVNIRTVPKQESNEPDVAILRLTHVDKINELVTNRSGAIAKFSFNDIIGQSDSIVKAKYLAHRFAASRENVFLRGESGTGKELFAQAIHNQYRPRGPFIAVNCAAMPRNLIESELFGYESGAFTGAEKNGRPGKIELANGGTLFFDEIGDMPYELQAVLLRVLQDKIVTRLGSKHYRQVDFRLITATNQNLQKKIQEKKFREDLYFRLSVLNIEIPPLRERGYDIYLLAEYFIKQCSAYGD
jgi:transcriptional regulator with PAS, ATPase and Fis domain